MFNLTAKQELLVEEFRERVADVLEKDSFFEFFLHRWLIARSWNVSKAEAMLRESAEWRRNGKVGSILTTWKPPEVITKYSPGGLVGCDKEGSPVWIETLGRLDVRGLLSSTTVSDMQRNRIYILEKCEQLNRAISEKGNKYTGGITMIYDMAHFGLKQLSKPALEFVAQTFYLSETHYPEQLKNGYIINAPKLFFVAYNISNRFLREESRKKTRVLGNDWKDELLEAIDASQLPVHWGGTMIDPDGDEYCQSKVCIGGDVPTAYYLKNMYKNNTSELSEIVITRRSTHKIELPVDTPKSIIRWQFHTEVKDIGFGIFRKTRQNEYQSVENMEPVLDNRRVNSHMVPEEGSLVAEEPGTYVMRFDNKYSWVSKKKLFYHVEVLPPTDELQNQSAT